MIYCLTFGYLFKYDYTLHIENNDQLAFRFDLLIRAFLKLGNVWVVQCIDWSFVSESTPVLLLAASWCQNKFFSGCLFEWVRFSGTISANTFVIFHSRIRSVTVALLVLTLLGIIQILFPHKFIYFVNFSFGFLQSLVVRDVHHLLRASELQKFISGFQRHAKLS